ncbi:MAG: methyltransferase domain-containing protein [Marmoricola sp.]
MALHWDPQLYLQFGDERARALVDLVSRIPADDPTDVVDLGCGPGNSTAILAQRWPRASLVGVDSSTEMIEKARASLPSASFEVDDLRGWLGKGGQADVVFTNATLQWLPGHLELIGELVGAVRAGGWLAIGVPGNVDEPSHVLREELAAEAPYAEFTKGTASPRAHDAETYLRSLRRLGCRVDAWESTYLHQLPAPDGVFDWVSGTSARPVLQALPDSLREQFAAELKARLREAYPAEDGMVVMPFRRIFVVAEVSAEV